MLPDRPMLVVGSDRREPDEKEFMRIEIDEALALKQLMYDNRCGGPLNLYLFDAAGRHSGPQRFLQTVSDTENEISVPEARARAEQHARTGGEVRITSPHDLVVYHVRDGVLIFPPENRVEFFWERAGY